MTEGTNVSIKAGTGDAPWLTFYGSVKEIGDQLIEAFGLQPQATDYMVDLAVEASKIAQGRWSAGTVLGGTPAQPAAAKPQWGSQSRGSSAPAQPQGGGAGGACDHGDRVYKEGTSKAGKAYKGWFCPRGVDGCKPEWA